MALASNEGQRVLKAVAHAVTIPWHPFGLGLFDSKGRFDRSLLAVDVG